MPGGNKRSYILQQTYNKKATGMFKSGIKGLKMTKNSVHHMLHISGIIHHVIFIYGTHV